MTELMAGFTTFMRTKNRIFEGERFACFFVRINDDLLAQVRGDVNFFLQHENMEKLLYSEGDNLHVIGLTIGAPIQMFKYIGMLLGKEKPKSISWWNPTGTRFFYKELAKW